MTPSEANADGGPGVAAEAYTELRASVTHVVRFVAREHCETFPGLPEESDDIVTVVGRSARRGLYGSFTPNCWRHGARTVSEIFINPAGVGGEVGHELAIQTFDTIVHELGHFINFSDDVKGTSRGGRWHNRRWAEVVFELGLNVVRDSRCGHTSAGIRPSFMDTYAEPLRELERALVLTWSPQLRSAPAPAPAVQLPVSGGAEIVQAKLKYLTASCACVNVRGKHRSIRVASGWWSCGPIRCGVCGSDFTVAPGVSDAAESTDAEVSL